MLNLFKKTILLHRKVTLVLCHLDELAEGDAHVSVGIGLLDGPVCDAAQLLVRNIHTDHHPQHLKHTGT